MSSQTVRCEICPKLCELGDGQAGDCRVRVNRGGRLIATTYARPCALHVDPIEKKPLFHFLPGSRSFSLATAGCNLHCLNCQNWEISQAGPLDVRSEVLEPEQAVALAKQYHCASISYTYSDPVAFYEYTLETSRAARAEGVRNVLVTAAYINAGPLREWCRVVDAVNADLKFFDDALYRSNCRATLQPVLDALKIFKEEGVWLEITNLVIPSLNDRDDSFQRLCDWVVGALGPDVPLHFSRFHPQYQLRELPPTPGEALDRARAIARQAGIRHAYAGNAWGSDGEHTSCAGCGRMLIRRVGFTIAENALDSKGACPDCGRTAPGIWSDTVHNPPSNPPQETAK